jgi:putative transposase
MTSETAKLHSQVKEVHRQSNGSAGARTVAMMATNNGYPLSRYRAGNIIKKLELGSCQLPKHAYQKATQEHVAIPNILDRQSLSLPSGCHGFICTETCWLGVESFAR